MAEAMEVALDEKAEAKEFLGPNSSTIISSPVSFSNVSDNSHSNR
jgi:hypothetical protein